MNDERDGTERNECDVRASFETARHPRPQPIDTRIYKDNQRGAIPQFLDRASSTQ